MVLVKQVLLGVLDGHYAPWN